MKRYKEYKQSGDKYIGMIPSHWEALRLGTIGVFSSSGIDKKSSSGEIPIEMVNYTDIIKSRKYFPVQDGSKTYMKVTTPASKLKEHRLQKGDIVLIPSSETSEDLGFSSLIDFDTSNHVYSYHILRFRFKREVFHNFKKYLVNHYMVLNQFSSNAKGTTRQIIGRDVFRNIKIILPPLTEQSQIVAYLDRKTALIDALIEKTDRKIALLKEKRTALINQAVTKGLDPTVPMKDSGVEWIGEIPEHWGVLKLKRTTALISEKGQPEAGDVKISPENVENDTGVCFNYHSDYSGEGMKFKKGDVLLNKLRIYLKKIIFAETSGFSMGEMIVLRCFGMEPKFLFHILFHDGLIELLNYASTGVKLPRVSPEEILNTYIPLPPNDEQIVIANYLDNRFKAIAEQNSILKKEKQLLKEYRQALISEVVTGKLKVSQDD